MDQWESEQELLKAQYRTMMTRIKEIRDEEKRNATARATQRSEELKDAMAREFKRYQDAGMPKYMMQDVLGTRDWSRWKDFERRGMLKSASQIRSAAKEQRELANAHFLWNDDYTSVTVKRAPDGTVLPEPLLLNPGHIFLITPKYWYMEGVDQENVRLNMSYARQYRPEWMQMLDAEITKQFEAGNIDNLPPKP